MSASRAPLCSVLLTTRVCSVVIIAVIGLAGIAAGGYFGVRKYRANKEFKEYQKAQAKTAQALNPQTTTAMPVGFDAYNGAMMNNLSAGAQPAMDAGFDGIDRASWMDATTMMSTGAGATGGPMAAHSYGPSGGGAMPRATMIANGDTMNYDAVW